MREHCMVRQAALVLCILLAGRALAQEQEVGPVESLDSSPWEFGPEISHFTYKEPGIMKDEGTFYGVVGSYTHRQLLAGDPARAATDANTPASWTTIRVEGRLTFGRVDYDGSYMDGTPLRMSGIDDFLFDIRLLVGREWRPAAFPSAFYAGLGYRYLSDDSSSEPGGYLRESNSLYLPLGSRADFMLKNAWSLELTGELDVLLVGCQLSHLDDVFPGEPEVRNWQWPGFGVRGAVALRHKSPSLDVALSPFVRYWWVAESDTSQGYYEPENNTLEYGLNVIFRL